MFKEGNEWMIEELQKEVDERWNRLLELEKMTNAIKYAETKKKQAEKLYKENIILIGMPSSGKTTIGKLLSEKLNRKLIDTDELIVDKIGMSIAEYLKSHTEKEFRDIETECVKEAAKLSGVVIATGGGAVLRCENVQALKQNGKLYFLKRDLNLLTPTQSRPFSSDYESLKRRYEERLPIYESVCDVNVDNNGDILDTVNAIIGDQR